MDQFNICPRCGSPAPFGKERAIWADYHAEKCGTGRKSEPVSKIIADTLQASIQDIGEAREKLRGIEPTSAETPPTLEPAIQVSEQVNAQVETTYWCVCGHNLATHRVGTRVCEVCECPEYQHSEALPNAADQITNQAIYDALISIETRHWDICPIQHDPRVRSCEYVGLVRTKREELEKTGIKKFKPITIEELF